MGDTRVESLKERFLSLVETQLNDVQNADAKELGEVMDMAKDCAELDKLCWEAKYYKTITESMGDVDEETKQAYMRKYIPELDQGRFYSGNYGRSRYYHDDMIYDPEMEYMRSMKDHGMGRMYYSNYAGGSGNSGSSGGSYYTNEMGMRDPREGRAGMARRNYMDMKDSGDPASKQKELEKYMQELAADMTEMLSDLTPQEKQVVKTKLTALANKVQ